jgi:LuxR family maltose regulon positive regulatory protein
VSRPRAGERLSRGAEAKLTLVTAPAGFGKTTLPAEWLAAPSAVKREVACLSLDQSDNHPTSFLDVPDRRAAGCSARGRRGCALPPTVDPVADRSGHCRATQRTQSCPDEVVLVLDGYHVIDGPRRPGKG